MHLKKLLLLAALSGACSAFIAEIPAVAEEIRTDQESYLSQANLTDRIKTKIGIQARSQAAGTPNQAGIGGFVPLYTTANSVLFADIQGNVNFPDVGDISSVVNTTISGSAISTSSRLGYRWLNGDKRWMYGLNAGYDTRPVTSSGINSGVTVGGEKTFLFQQVGINAEAISDTFAFNIYALLPASETQHALNDSFQMDELTTYGVDIGHYFSPQLKGSIGYYLQHNPAEDESDGSGVLGRLSYQINSSTLLGANVSYDQEFRAKASFDITWRFRTGSRISGSSAIESPLESALSSSPSNRDIRIEIE